MVCRKNLMSGCLIALVVPALGVLCFGQEADRQGDDEVRQEIERLSCPDAKDRAAAATRLGVLGEKSAVAVPLLIKMLTDHPPSERNDSLPMFSPASAALESLVRIGKPALPALLESLSNEEIRHWSIDALGRIGDRAAIPPLLVLIRDEKPDIRARASLALGRIGGLDSPDPLLSATKDPHPLVRHFALVGLGFLQDRRAAQPLVELLNDPSYSDREEVSRALGRLKSASAVEPLIEILREKSVSLRCASAYALGEIGDRRATKPLIQLLDDSWIHIRVAAVRALIQLKDTSAYPDIVKLFTAKDPILRQLAAEELGAAGADAVPALTEALLIQDPNSQESARAALKKIYGNDFDNGGKEWLAWKREFFKKFGRLEDLDAIKSKPVESALQKEIVAAVTFTVPSLTQINAFYHANDRVIASILYTDGRKPSPLSHEMIDNIKSALVAWNLEGHLLWKTDMPWARHLLVADDKIVLVHDRDELHPDRGIIWVDPTSGREIRHIQFPGAPGNLCFNKTTKLLVMTFYPKERLSSLDGGMEVRAYRMDGDLAWKRRESVSELYGFSLDGPTIVVGSFMNKAFIAGLDAASGKELWRRAHGRFPSLPDGGMDNLPQSHRGLVAIPGHEGFEFIDPRSGKVLHAIPREGQIQSLSFNTDGNGDRLYFTSGTTPDGVTLIAMEFPSGKPLWTDRTGTMIGGAPTAWGINNVFLGRRYSEGALGRIVLTELRIYSPVGTLLLTSTTEVGKEHPQFWDMIQPQATDRYLYAVKDNKLHAFQWKDANK